MGALLAAGIRFNDYVFSEPVRLAEWRPPKCAGFFVILARDPNWSPKPFQPLYFGEFGNNSRETFPADGTLYAAALLLPYSTTGQRWSLRNELVWAYNPTCQSGGDRMSVRELARRVDEMEVRQQEHDSQLLLLLTNLNKMFEPQTVGPRRPIGFLPATEAGSSR
jgi:hypothetical protein